MLDLLGVAHILRVCNSHIIMPVVDPFGRIYRCCLTANPKIASLKTYLGQVTEGDLLSVIQRSTENPFPITNCFSCNPPQKNMLCALNKIKRDVDNGLPLEKFPYNPMLI